jgi:acetyl-CoA carboxylase biotin carboxyl carrier protein
MIDLEWVKRLIRTVNESDIDSLEISRFVTRIRIAKSPPIQLVQGVPGVAPVAPAALSPPPAPPGSTASAATSPEAEARSTEGLIEVVSPMVGTFYRAPAPDAPAYVEVGDSVSDGQTLCILEAMKLMNELESEVSGSVREVCVQNGEPVEYGQVLFRIAPK